MNTTAATAAAAAAPQTRFVRRTALTAGEARCNFRQIDQDAIRVTRSRQARQVTNLMMHIYMCLIDAPFKFRQSEGELYFGGEVRDGKHITAWEQLTELLEVADGTALKALRWLHEQEVIGYCSRKNGGGIRIFLNRAVSSIKQLSPYDQKNLPPVPVANSGFRTSRNAIPFKEVARKKLDEKINTFRPENGAGLQTAVEALSEQATNKPAAMQAATAAQVEQENTNLVNHTLPANVINQLRKALEPTLRAIASQAASHESAREGERTRQWLDRYGLPKAARVAQREAYSVFKHHSAKIDASERVRAELQVGRGTVTTTSPEMKHCTTAEISEIAEACVTVLEVQGKSIDLTLAEISATSGGWVVPEDVSKVREAAHALLLAKSKRRIRSDCSTS